MASRLTKLNVSVAASAVICVLALPQAATAQANTVSIDSVLPIPYTLTPFAQPAKIGALSEAVQIAQSGSRSSRQFTSPIFLHLSLFFFRLTLSLQHQPCRSTVVVAEVSYRSRRRRLSALDRMLGTRRRASFYLASASTAPGAYRRRRSYASTPVGKAANCF